MVVNASLSIGEHSKHDFVALCIADPKDHSLQEQHRERPVMSGFYVFFALWVLSDK